MIGLKLGCHLFRNHLYKRILYDKATNQANKLRTMVIRKVSTQITKNLYLISKDKKPLLDRTTLKIESALEKPLVVLLTWLLAKQKHVNKFNNIYLDQGFDVLNISVSPWQILWPAKGTHMVAKDILNFLENNSSYSPLLLHGFSVGGYVWGEVLVKIVEDRLRYQPIVNRICGQIWDSGADITEIPVGMPKAIFPKNKTLENCFRQYLEYHLRTFHNIATSHYMKASEVFHNGIVKSPALILLSKTDPVGSYSSNLKVKEDWEAIGIEVDWKCWDKSPHVSHFYYHPKEYTAEVYNFLDKLNLLLQPEKLQMQAKL